MGFARRNAIRLISNRTLNMIEDQSFTLFIFGSEWLISVCLSGYLGTYQIGVTCEMCSGSY